MCHCIFSFIHLQSLHPQNDELDCVTFWVVQQFKNELSLNCSVVLICIDVTCRLNQLRSSEVCCSWSERHMIRLSITRRCTRRREALFTLFMCFIIYRSLSYSSFRPNKLNPAFRLMTPFLQVPQFDESFPSQFFLVSKSPRTRCDTETACSLAGSRAEYQSMIKMQRARSETVYEFISVGVCGWGCVRCQRHK